MFLEMALSQVNAPIYEALRRFRRMRVVPFDVPGHKRGRGNMELTEFLGEDCMNVDVNSMKPLDNLCHPVSVIRDAEELAADAFGAAHAFFMVGGTTSAVQSMIMYACKSGDKIIMPRNVHRSAINALILTGAVPVYVNPEVNNQLGIALGMSVEQVERAIRENPQAKAISESLPSCGKTARTVIPAGSAFCSASRMASGFASKPAFSVKSANSVRLSVPTERGRAKENLG